jgi:hypothetical protein
MTITVIRKAAKLGLAVVKHAADGFVEVSSEEKEARLEVCKNCPKFNKEFVTCGVCGCHLNIKAAWRSESCPLGKWAGDEPIPEAAPVVPKSCCGQ